MSSYNFLRVHNLLIFTQFLLEWLNFLLFLFIFTQFDAVYEIIRDVFIIWLIEVRSPLGGQGTFDSPRFRCLKVTHSSHSQQAHQSSTLRDNYRIESKFNRSKI